MTSKKLKRFRDYPANVPRRLIKAYRAAGCNTRRLEKTIGVNNYYICKLMNEGIEPSNSDIRGKLFLSPRNVCRLCGRKITQPRQLEKKPKPEFLRLWNRLPTEERHKVIQEYLKWKNDQ